MTKLEELVKIIEDHPNCTIMIDNDMWEILGGVDGVEPIVLATSEDYKFRTDWFGHSANYGMGIAEALKIILNKSGFNLNIQGV